MNLHSVEVLDIAGINNGYRLKIGVLDLGLYVYGFTARKSDINSSGWWIQPPAVNVNGRWKSTLEFDKSKSLWPEIEEACINAAKEADSETYTEIEIPKEFNL